jgi:hypothetical protein
MLNYLSAFVCCVQIHREQRNSEKNERERETTSEIFGVEEK